VQALQRARMDFDRVRAQLKRSGEQPSPDAAAQARRELDAAAREVARHAPMKEAPAGRKAGPGQLTVGVEVLIPRLGGRGTVTSVAPGKVAVQVGALKLTVSPDELLLPEGKGGLPPQKPHFGRSAEERMAVAEANRPRALPRTSGNTCDLRGERVDTALALAEKFVDDGLRAGQDAVFLLHGHGTGALRGALRDHFAKFPGVSGLRPGEPDEGGDGVTVVLLG
jgi:DNA mismatch repair protein MutS2